MTYDVYEKYNAIIFGVLAQNLLTPLHAKTMRDMLKQNTITDHTETMKFGI